MPKKQTGDVQEQVLSLEDLPKPTVEVRSRDYRRHKCPQCARSCYRDKQGHRYLRDLGNPRTGRPHMLEVFYSRHRCEKCGIYFSADMSALAPPGSHYTHRVISRAVRVVLEDGLPYRSASWHLWRDHHVFVPFATIQNWVEDTGEKKKRAAC